MASKKMTPAEAMQDLQKRQHRIAKGSAQPMVKAFEKAAKKLEKAKKDGSTVPAEVPQWPKCWTFNKNLFQKLLKKPDVQGIRFFPALSDDGSVTLVVVAVDSEGNNIKSAEKAVAPKSAAKRSPMALNTSVMEMDNDAFDEAQKNPPFSGDTSL